MRKDRDSIKPEAGSTFIVSVSSPDDNQEHTPNMHVYLASQVMPNLSLMRRIKGTALKLGGITLALFLGLGVPIAYTMNQQGDRIITEGLTPAQEDLRVQLHEAKEDLREDMKTAVRETGDEFQLEMEAHIDEKIDEIFGPLLDEPLPDGTTTTTTTVSPQG